MKSSRQIKYAKINILICIIFISIFYCMISPLYSYCSETQTVTITKEDIMRATPKSPYIVAFTPKELKAIEIMEKRHFGKTYPEFSDKERIKNLEYELLERVWEFSPTDLRIKKLKIASSNVMLIGTALPTSINSKRNAKRMRNDDIQIRKRDDVGLIDGLLRLISPEKYEMYRKNADELYYKYEY